MSESLPPAAPGSAPASAGAGAGGGPAEGSRSGGCLCGAVRYRIGLPARWVAHCHCSMCRRAHGAGFVTWVGAAAERFVLESGSGVLGRYQSSPAATRSFCSRCGSPLLFQSSRWPGEIHVTLASLDDPSGLDAQAHAYWGSRAGWLGWDGGPLAKVEPEE